ncbi:hypothetical protein PR048_003683 [Dryococelus australis]|uniref:Uncharacterized protein n=1 Tax=Dryococelus australis TaxID=614101 RepID=A0ABQ9INQ2_9NEOP|nr:hypothetical protein PR048_003683 [Dryococelus australis]
MLKKNELRKPPKPGAKTVQRQSLVDPNKILLPPLHIKIGLMKQYVKALRKDGSVLKISAASFLDSHLDYCPENLGAMSERFHRDIKEKERRYHRRWNVSMITDYCWMLKREGLFA